MSIKKGFAIGILLKLFEGRRPSVFSMDIQAVAPKKEKALKISKRKLKKLKGKKARKNRGKKRSTK